MLNISCFINDVSAINAADVGISVENAVDVIREATDFVLMEKELMVLVDGIRRKVEKHLLTH